MTRVPPWGHRAVGFSWGGDPHVTSGDLLFTFPGRCGVWEMFRADIGCSLQVQRSSGSRRCPVPREGATTRAGSTRNHLFGAASMAQFSGEAPCLPLPREGGACHAHPLSSALQAVTSAHTGLDGPPSLPPGSCPCHRVSDRWPNWWHITPSLRETIRSRSKVGGYSRLLPPSPLSHSLLEAMLSFPGKRAPSGEKKM